MDLQDSIRLGWNESLKKTSKVGTLRKSGWGLRLPYWISPKALLGITSATVLPGLTQRREKLENQLEARE